MRKKSLIVLSSIVLGMCTLCGCNEEFFESITPATKTEEVSVSMYDMSTWDYESTGRFVVIDNTCIKNTKLTSLSIITFVDLETGVQWVCYDGTSKAEPFQPVVTANGSYAVYPEEQLDILREQYGYTPLGVINE